MIGRLIWWLTVLPILLLERMMGSETMMTEVRDDKKWGRIVTEWNTVCVCETWMKCLFQCSNTHPVVVSCTSSLVPPFSSSFSSLQEIIIATAEFVVPKSMPTPISWTMIPCCCCCCWLCIEPPSYFSFSSSLADENNNNNNKRLDLDFLNDVVTSEVRRRCHGDGKDDNNIRVVVGGACIHDGDCLRSNALQQQ